MLIELVNLNIVPLNSLSMLAKRMIRFVTLILAGLLLYIIAWLVDSESLDNLILLLTFQSEGDYTSPSSSFVTLYENSINIMVVLLSMTVLEILLGDLWIIYLLVAILILLGLITCISVIISIFSYFGIGFGLLSILIFIVNMFVIGIAYFIYEL
jgi:hypothetical protein